jgi:hypothetical protein
MARINSESEYTYNMGLLAQFKKALLDTSKPEEYLAGVRQRIDELYQSLGEFEARPLGPKSFAERVGEEPLIKAAV